MGEKQQNQHLGAALWRSALSDPWSTHAVLLLGYDTAISILTLIMINGNDGAIFLYPRGGKDKGCVGWNGGCQRKCTREILCYREIGCVAAVIVKTWVSK